MVVLNAIYNLRRIFLTIQQLLFIYFSSYFILDNIWFFISPYITVVIFHHRQQRIFCSYQTKIVFKFSRKLKYLNFSLENSHSYPEHFFLTSFHTMAIFHFFASKLILFINSKLLLIRSLITVVFSFFFLQATTVF